MPARYAKRALNYDKRCVDSFCRVFLWYLGAISTLGQSKASPVIKTEKVSLARTEHTASVRTYHIGLRQASVLASLNSQDSDQSAHLLSLIRCLQQYRSTSVSYSIIALYIHLCSTIMNGWMTCDFTSFSTVFQSYQDDGRLMLLLCCCFTSKVNI